MRIFLVITELGLLLIDEKMGNVLASQSFPPEQRATLFLDASSGTLSEDHSEWLKTRIGSQDIALTETPLSNTLMSLGMKSETSPIEALNELSKKRLEFLVESGLAPSFEAAEEMIRDVSIQISNLRIKESSARPDLQATQSVQALDEIDKTANVISSRLREWYGLHFPELVSMIDDNTSFIKLISNFKSRENYDLGELEQMGYSKNKSLAIVTAAKESRGADIREEDRSRILQLAEEAQHLFALRDKLSAHVEKTMRQIAPNISEIAGASIGARLIAKAGGLDRLSTLPASTIQILGAEKALYRALKSGSRPPKHGILFQHAAVHGAPKWQRGRIARAVAGKIAISARIDRFRGTKDQAVERSLNSRLDEIKLKYKDAPKEAPADFFPREMRHSRPGRDSDRGGRFSKENLRDDKRRNSKKKFQRKGR